MSIESATGARLSTTSEGLWLTAALAGVSRLPAALRVRPVGDVNAMLAGHPGLQVLADQGICTPGVLTAVGDDDDEATWRVRAAGALDEDVYEWLWTLGRPDIEVIIEISRPAEQSDRLLGPPPLLDLGVDPETHPVEAYAALQQWRAEQPPQRAAVLCRRDGQWVCAARVWQVGAESFDEIVVSPLGAADIGTSVNEILGHVPAAEFEGINQPAQTIEPIVTAWQAEPSMDVVSELAAAGLTIPQARVLAAAADASATRITVCVMEHSVDGPAFGGRTVTVLDSLYGRVLISGTDAAESEPWTMIFPGTARRITKAVNEMCSSVPSGADWVTHQRTRPFHSN